MTKLERMESKEVSVSWFILAGKSDCGAFIAPLAGAGLLLPKRRK